MVARNKFTISLVACIILMFATFSVLAEGEKEVRDEKIDAAVEKAIKYLKGKQQADGSWIRDNGPFRLNIPMNEGTTALVLYALLKCGVDPNDECIRKGFNHIRQAGFNHTYAVACFCMALEALYSAHSRPKKKKKKDDPYATGLEEPETPRGIVRNPADLKLFQQAIDWLVSKQEDNVWRYPSPGGDPTDGALAKEDASNAQYVALAFSAARRINLSVRGGKGMGTRVGRGRQLIHIPPEVFHKILGYYVEKQEKDGPVVKPPFVVPAADHSFKKLDKIRFKFQRDLRRAAKKEKRKKETPGFYRTAVKQEAQDKIYGGEGKPMKARGWCYMLGSKMAWRTAINGSMTTSGIVACVISKAWLEDYGQYGKWQKKCDQAIRDGCAWLAHNFSVGHNPCSNGKPCMHHYYYLYGLERAGVLSMAFKFAKHDWFAEGSRQILGQQSPDGSWQIGNGTVGPVVDTCFAVLFLRRATKPIVDVGATTGAGLLK